jgi:hypothetical protein
MAAILIGERLEYLDHAISEGLEAVILLERSGDAGGPR